MLKKLAQGIEDSKKEKERLVAHGIEDAISEYRQKVALYNDRVEELNNVTQQRDDLKKLYDDFRQKRMEEFMAGFNTISLKLKEMYLMITFGGDPELELVDTLDYSLKVLYSVYDHLRNAGRILQTY